jgi:hypothetical protein
VTWLRLWLRCIYCRSRAELYCETALRAVALHIWNQHKLRDSGFSSAILLLSFKIIPVITEFSTYFLVIIVRGIFVCLLFRMIFYRLYKERHSEWISFSVATLMIMKSVQESLVATPRFAHQGYPRWKYRQDLKVNRRRVFIPMTSIQYSYGSLLLWAKPLCVDTPTKQK